MTFDLSFETFNHIFLNNIATVTVLMEDGWDGGEPKLDVQWTWTAV